MGAHLPLCPAGDTHGDGGRRGSAGAPQTNSQEARCPPAPQNQVVPQPQHLGGQPHDALPRTHSCTYIHTRMCTCSHTQKSHTQILAYLHTAHTHTVSSNLSACSRIHTGTLAHSYTHVVPYTQSMCTYTQSMRTRTHSRSHMLTCAHSPPWRPSRLMPLCTVLPSPPSLLGGTPQPPGASDDRLLALSGQ